MAKAPSLEAVFAQLTALRAGGSAAGPEIQKYLASKVSFIVAKAADVARELNLKNLQPALESAFARFMQNPAATDKGCSAKQAIANALYELGCDAQETFLTGIHHVQKEGSFGKPVDTAAELRGICALGLVRMAYREVMNELVKLLVDEDPRTRLMAPRAIAYAGREEGALLLRLKILTGDALEDVTAECLLALGTLSRTKAQEFIADYLDSPYQAVAQSAAIALGEMRDGSALTVLLERWDSAAQADVRQTLALPIALSRLPRSLEFLLNIIATETPVVAVAAIEALTIYRHADSARSRVEAAVNQRDNAAVTAAYAKTFAL